MPLHGGLGVSCSRQNKPYDHFIDTSVVYRTARYWENNPASEPVLGRGLFQPVQAHRIESAAAARRQRQAAI
jgi:hypothetical protein